MKRRFSCLLLCAMMVLQMFALSACGECDHDWDDWEIEKEATCEEDGLKVRQCDECGEEEKKEIKALGHIEEDMKDIEPTCDKEGSEGGIKCEVCGKIIDKPEKIAKIDHSYIEAITAEASCDAAGTKTFTCENCDASYSEEYSLSSYTASEIHEMAKNSVCEILTYDKNGEGLSLGSGFVYTSDGQFITNYHVIDRAYSAQLKINGKTYDVSNIIAYDKDIDLAIIKVTTTDSFTALPLCATEHPTGSQIYALGSSQGFTDTFSQGIITNSRREEEGVVHIQHSASISSGNSGGPLINEFCEIIGINTWVYLGESGVAQNLNFAVSVEEIANLTTVNYTMADFYATEFNPFVLLKDFVMEENDYDAEDKEYFRALSYDEYDDFYTMSAIWYAVDTEIFTIAFTMDNEYTVYLEVDSNFTGIYSWYYYDKFDNYMEGNIYASLYRDTSTLIATKYDVSDYNDCIDMASILMDYLCTYLNYDYVDIGLNAQDFGFDNF